MPDKKADERSDVGGRSRRFLHWRTVENVVFVFVLLLATYRIGPQLAAAAGIDLGVSESPAMVLETLDGEVVTLAALRGEVVLVNFWATWCTPCKLEMPGFAKVYENRRDEGFTILGVATDAVGEARVRAFLEDKGVTYPVGMATLELRRSFGGIREIPTSFLIDRQGRIRYTVRGFFAPPALNQAISRLLSEPEGDPSSTT